MFVVGAGCAFAAIGLWRRSLWGIRIALVILSLNIFGDLLNAVLRHDYRALIGLPVGGAMIFYLARYKTADSSSSRCTHFSGAGVGFVKHRCERAAEVLQLACHSLNGVMPIGQNWHQAPRDWCWCRVDCELSKGNQIQRHAISYDIYCLML